MKRLMRFTTIENVRKPSYKVINEYGIKASEKAYILSLCGYMTLTITNDCPILTFDIFDIRYGLIPYPNRDFKIRRLRTTTTDAYRKWTGTRQRVRLISPYSLRSLPATVSKRNVFCSQVCSPF